jgi:hypothetical protein
VSGDSPEPGAARLEEGALRLFGIMRVSFQRCAVPAEGVHRTPVRSLGMLPVGRDQEGTFCVPVAEDESFWLGVSMEKRGAPFRLFAQMGDKHRLNVHSGRPAAADADSAFQFSGFGAIYGIPRDTESWWSFRRVAAEPMRACEWLIFAQSKIPLVEKALVQTSVLLVSYETYRQRTHQPPPAPLDPSAGYGGWLLP